MSELYREWNDLELAAQHLLSSEALGDPAGLAQNPYRWRVAMARVREAEGDLDAALELLDEAERLYASDYYPNVRPISAMKARIWIAQGRLSRVHGWARAQHVSVDDELDYVREFDHITLARLLLAGPTRNGGGDPAAEAPPFLERLLRVAEAGRRTRSVIEILVLEALAHQLRGDTAAGLAPLERALSLAEADDFVRVFADEGPPMADLLGAAAKRQIAPGYVRRLLAAFGHARDRAPIKQPLVEPLSERELDVLRLLATDLAGPEIARELVVSLSTVRSHTKAIYAKLGVNSRRSAVSRADELHLLSRARQQP